MSMCPYTWVVGLLSNRKKSAGEEAYELRVQVQRGQVTTVNVTLPAQSARWLIDLIPDEVLIKIREEGIPLEKIQSQLKNQTKLFPQNIFQLAEDHRVVSVWLE